MWVNFVWQRELFVQGLRDFKTDFLVFVFLFIGDLRKGAKRRERQSPGLIPPFKCSKILFRICHQVLNSCLIQTI